MGDPGRRSGAACAGPLYAESGALAGAGVPLAVMILLISACVAPAFAVPAAMQGEAGGSKSAPKPQMAASAVPAPRMDVAVAASPRPGPRPDSFFASTVPALLTGDELRLLASLGIKVQRASLTAALAADVPAAAADVPDVPAGRPLAIDFSTLDRALAESRAAGVSILPVVGPGSPGTVRPEVPVRGASGLPRDFDEFAAAWAGVVRHYPDLLTWDFWENPRVFSPTWAASGDEFRRLLAKWCAAARKASPKVRLTAGSSAAFIEDQVEPHPTAWVNLVSGLSHEPAAVVDVRSMRDGSLARSIDHGAGVARRMGLPYYYVTGGWGRSAQHGGPDDDIAACLLVQYAVRAALCGAFQVDMPWEIACGPGRTRSNAAVAVLAHMIEDRPILADIWPENELIFGAVFAHPRHATAAVRRLPRAAELAARWDVPVPEDRRDDAVKVAVVWRNAGRDAGGTGGDRSNDTVSGGSRIGTVGGGTLTIDDARGLRAYDVFGREIPTVGGRLVVPLGESPIYIVTESLDVVALRERVAAARIDRVPPVTLYALSLARPAHELQQLSVRIENQLNRQISGTLVLEAGEGGQATEAAFVLPPAKLAEVTVPWPGVKSLAQNEYAAMLTARTDAGDVTRRQIVAVAAFIQRSIKVDGDLADWAGATPVLVDSDRPAAEADLAAYLKSPRLDRPTGTPDRRRIMARIYTSYDDFSVYLAAEVHEDEFACRAGLPVRSASFVDGRAAPPAGGSAASIPLKEGVPDGVGHIRLAGDAILFAFGFRDRVSGWGRQMDDPYAWKGNFYDTDFLYAAHSSADGDRLVRLWAPDTTRRGAYQGGRVPGYGPVAGGKIVIRRDEKRHVTIYEMSIPRLELYLFDPNRGRCRFGFVVANGEGLGRQGGLEWSEAAGVFDHWRSLGSFAPSTVPHLACQTYFGIERLAPQRVP